MELKIYNSILFGSLKPWAPDKNDEKFISGIIREAGKINIKGTPEIFKCLNILLQEHQELLKFEDNFLDGNHIELIEPLFEIRLPKHFNVKTQFYSDLMKIESLRFMNNLNAGVIKRDEDIDKRYLIKIALRNISYLAQNASTEIVSRGFINIPDYSPNNKLPNEEIADRNIHFILYYLKMNCIRIYFEVQELFKLYLTQYQSIDDFFTTTLTETPPAENILNPTTFYFHMKVKQIISETDYSFDVAVELLDMITTAYNEGNNKITDCLAVLENYLFIKTHNIETTLQDFASFAAAGTSNNLFENAKSLITNKLVQLAFGYQRLEIVNNELENISFLKAEINIFISAPRKLRKWLLQQKELYTKLFSEKLPAENPANNKVEPQESATKKISFGFNGNVEKLKNVLEQLCLRLELLNSDKSSSGELLDVLTSKSIAPNETKIYLGCETAQFRYIIDKLRSFFSNLTAKEIEASETFYSKKEVKMKAQNLYSGKIAAPKNQATIDSIINQLQ